MMLMGTNRNGNGFGLGLGAAGALSDEDVLDHALAPFRGRTRYLRLVTTMKLALDYAAGGFHVSVSRGLQGGCGDPAPTYSDWVIRAVQGPVTCSQPLNLPAARAAWAESARRYLAAYEAGRGGASLETVKDFLRHANATNAYAVEGLGPGDIPSDPKAPEASPEIMVTAPRYTWVAFATITVVSIALATGIGYVADRQSTSASEGM